MVANDTLFVDQDTPPRENPFADAKVKAQLKDFLGRPIEPDAPVPTLADADLPDDVKAQARAACDVEHTRAMVARHEAEAAAGANPFAKTTTTEARTGMAAKPTIHPARPAAPPPVIRTERVESVAWFWNYALGMAKGYTLYRAAFGPITLLTMDERVTAALPRPIVNKADTVKVNWLVRWHLNARGEAELDSIQDMSKEQDVKPIGEAVKDVVKDVEAKHAEHVANRAPSEFDHWIHDAAERKDYWSKVHSAFNKWKVADRGREDFCHSVLGVQHTDEFKGTKAEAIALIAAEIDKVYGKPQETKLVSEQPEVKPQDAPGTNEKADPRPDPVPSGVIPNALPEAPFSANFHLFHKTGVNIQFTVRADTVSEGVKRVDATVDHLLKNGYTVDRPGQQTAQHAAANGSAASSAPSSTNDGGKVPCSLIKVGTSFEGGKPQLQFECDGFEDPLKYTRGRGDMVRLLSKVKTFSGAAITESDIEVGKKFVGAWLVTWDKSEKDGKTYRNVVAVEPAA